MFGHIATKKPQNSPILPSSKPSNEGPFNDWLRKIQELISHPAVLAINLDLLPGKVIGCYFTFEQRNDSLG
jgi:hypothetical protein